MRTTIAAALLAFAAALAPPAQAQPYPEKPITFVVPFSAGGDADLAGRNLGAAAQAILKQPVVVANKAGASGGIGSQQVKDAAPDGYTLLIARVGSNAVLPALKRDLGYKWNDFTFLGLLELNPVVCVVHPDSPYRTLDDLGRALAAQPGKLNYSSSGIGTILHLGSQLLMQSFKLKGDAAAHVAYKGGGEAALAVVSRDVDFSCGNLTSAIGLLKGGRLRALVVTTPERVKDIPEVPTAREAGHPQLEAIVGWSALYGPPGMPREIVARWAQVLQQVAKDPQWIAGEEKIGSIPRILPPHETERFVAEQFRVYEQLGRQLGLELK
ncbi:MAG TPA: tripartite tricarboxylate transporter substrate binding protein [Usitatibacter sp.]|nr:tripartite tricarboxylate transporter substrate binding protein [Usitatibacter sp.]